MKITFLKILFLVVCTALHMNAQTDSNGPAATILGVMHSKDARMLVIRYELRGRDHQLELKFAGNITDFRYCNWLGDGIAVAVSTGTNEFYYPTSRLDHSDGTITPIKIPAPNSPGRLLGIANTGGDSIVITAVQHRRLASTTNSTATDQLTGWMFIDNCPPIGGKVGRVIPFDIAGETMIR